MKAQSRLMLSGVVIALATLFVTDAYARHSRPGCTHACPTGRIIDPIVSTDWLEANRGADDLVVLDIRPLAAYAASHIPSSVNEPFTVPFSVWVTMRDELLLEFPPAEELFFAIGSLGIAEDTRVVIVTAPNPNEPAAYGLSNAARVAMTLLYAGIKQVSILDGGFPQWEREGLPTTTEVPSITSVEYLGVLNQDGFVTRRYVERHIGWTPILDNRDADVYFGATTEAFADQAGHIPSARSLPAPFMWRADGTYVEEETLAKMASGVIQNSRYHEVIVYCGVGGYSSAWWFVLSQVLGYKNVKLYDGAAQEWVRYAKLIPYRWD